MAAIPSLYDDLKSLPGDQQYIRLLILLPAPFRDRPLKCMLTTQCLDGIPPYSALSYVWGVSTDKASIECNGISLDITKNLAAALLHIRHHEEHKAIWVDAICINQASASERASQVMLMGRVYSSAVSTMIWLGEQSEKSRIALSLCRSFANEMSGSLLPSEDQIPGLDEEDFLNMCDLLDRPWWSRVWVVQELCLSASPFVQVGPDNIPWMVLELALELIWRLNCRYAQRGAPRGFSTSQRLEHSNMMVQMLTHRGFRNARMMISMRKRIQSSRPKEDLLDVLLRLQDFQATDQRDKVFALLGIVDSQSHGVQPDYTISVNECYMQAAASIVKAKRNLSIFNVPFQSEAHRDANLPSWVPHWNRDAPTSSEIPLRSLWDYSIIELREIGVAQARDFPCARGSLVDLAKLDSANLGVLSLSGILADSIHVTKDVLSISSPTTAEIEMAHRSAFLRLFLDSTIHNGSTLETLQQWKEFAMLQGPYSGEDWWHVFCSTITFGEAVENIETSSRQISASWKSVIGGSVSRALGRPVRAAFPRLHLLIRGVLFGYTLFRRQPDIAEFMSHIYEAYDRRLAKTEKGHLALVPPSTRTGDRIILLAGGKTPYVARQSSGLPQQWELVGDCYVHGIMFGEAWEEDLCVKMQFS
jgi:Heterokaryon incompatibility protein (HET)